MNCSRTLRSFSEVGLALKNFARYYGFKATACFLVLTSLHLPIWADTDPSPLLAYHSPKDLTPYELGPVNATPGMLNAGSIGTGMGGSAVSGKANSLMGGPSVSSGPIINNIIFQGNNIVSDDALLIKMPYRVGQVFDPLLSGTLIRNIYSLKYFDYIELQVERLPDNKIDLIVVLKEKKRLEGIVYEGNSNLTENEIETKYKFSEIPAINEEEVGLLAEQIKRLYREKNYHDVKIETEVIETSESNAKIIFVINEGKRALVKQINFVGNTAFSPKKLRSLMFTREDWLLGAMDKSGTFQPEMIEYDQHLIENFYQSSGFLAARVKDTKIDIDPKTQNIAITFFIEEGDLYTVNDIDIDETSIFTKEELLSMVPVRPGQLYNKELLRYTIETLRTVFGQYGYIYADIEPVPVPDFENKTVDIKFNLDLGGKVFLNRLNIMGNHKTRDYVIRRILAVNEGDMLTTSSLDVSKARAEGLGYFDPKDGVNFKITKIDDTLADVDFVVNEIKTGKFFSQVGFGGADIKSPSSSMKITAGVSDRNLFGRGIRYSFNVSYSKEDSGVFFNIFQPWLFDRPIGGGVDFYTRRSTYEDFVNVSMVPVENVTGIVGNLTFSPQRFPDLSTFVNAGMERIRFDNPVMAEIPGTPQEKALFQNIVNRRFEDGTITWLGFLTGQDLRNHPVFPSAGYNWNIAGKFGLPTSGSRFSFFKVDLDGVWLTPLIGDFDLIFMLHGHAGFAMPFGTRDIPYRELYHIGGPATVRGFRFGQIGPQIFGDSIGAQKAFWINAELILSVTRDQSIRGVLFYDGGAGWDTPSGQQFIDLGLQNILVNNRFNFRHAIGFGIRLTQPTPLRVDWAFKLDRNKRIGENVMEVHFSTAQEF